MSQKKKSMSEREREREREKERERQRETERERKKQGGIQCILYTPVKVAYGWAGAVIRSLLCVVFKMSPGI